MVGSSVTHLLGHLRRLHVWLSCYHILSDVAEKTRISGSVQISPYPALMTGKSAAERRRCPLKACQSLSVGTRIDLRGIVVTALVWGHYMNFKVNLNCHLHMFGRPGFSFYDRVLAIVLSYTLYWASLGLLFQFVEAIFP